MYSTRFKEKINISNLVQKVNTQHTITSTNIFVHWTNTVHHPVRQLSISKTRRRSKSNSFDAC